MKKIGILYGQENTFPFALVDKINALAPERIQAESLTVGEVIQAKPSDYAVILDRISQDVPFYRAFLKNAAIAGAAVLNNPFWWSADEKFFNNALSETIGVPVPKTALLPSKERPEDTKDTSFRNMKFPLEWEEMFDYLGGFPLYMKPHAGGGWKHVYKVNSKEEFFAAYAQTGQLVMMLQEAIDFDSYFRCYCLGREHVHIMHYEPRNPHHLRYVANFDVSDELLGTIERYCLELNHALGYDFNTVEFAVRDGVPYAIDFCNPAPDADVHSVGEENFEWVVEHSAKMLIARAQQHKPGQMNLTWGTFVRDAVAGMEVSNPLDNDSTPISSIPLLTNEAALPTVEKITSFDPTLAQEALLEHIGHGAENQQDDLKQIKGIGPKMEQLLNGIGIQTFEQLSRVTDKEYDLIDGLLDVFKGRGKRDDWAGQARQLLGE